MRSNALIATAVTAATLIGLGGSVAHAAPATDSSQPKTVTVQPGQTLSQIGTDNNTTYIRLFNANSDISDPDVINPGQKIRVPAPDEQLADRPLPLSAPAVAAAPAQAYRPTAARQTTAAPVAGGSQWDSLAACESGGNWATDTGNGYYGGLQFTPSSWRAAGGSGLPSDASRDEQIARAQVLQSRSGWGAWPACAAKLGLF